MLQQVSKGEFDRRVKLLEQKVQESTNSLINRLQAESEAFIEKLRNTQLDIDALRQEVEEIEGDDTKLNSLIDSYNNFAANTLRFNDVFDTDGQFTGKIRPLSVETAALSVGTRSQQLDLSGIEFRVLPYLQPNYGYLEIVSSEHSKYKFNSSGTALEYVHGNTTDTASLGNAGTMFHYGYGTNTNPKLYGIDEQRILIGSTDLHYIYARILYNVKEYEVKIIDSNGFNKYFYELYIDNSGTKIRVAEIGYNSSTTYYTKTAGNFTSLGTISGDIFANNIDNLYTSNNDSSKVTKPQYNNSTTYYVKYNDVDIDTSASKADIIISTQKYTAFQDNSSSPSYPYYENNKHYIVIKIGSISQEQTSAIYDDTSSTYYKQRKVDMTYGQTTIDGRLITTGRIEGNGTYFDLDQGIIGGDVRFQAGTGSQNKELIDSIINSNNNVLKGVDAKNAFDNLEVGGRNLIAGTSDTDYVTLSLSSSSSGPYTEYSKSIKRIDGKDEYILSFEAKGNVEQNLICHWYSPNTTTNAESSTGYTSTSSDGYCQVRITTDWKKYWVKWKQSDTASTNKNLIIGRIMRPSSGTLTVYIRAAKFEYGNMATDWSPAPEDQASINDVGYTYSTQTAFYFKYYTGTIQNTDSIKPSKPTSIPSSTWNFDTWTYALPPVGDGTTTTYYVFTSDVTISEKNSTKAFVSATDVKYDQGSTTSIYAMRQKEATISGGLILGTKIICQDNVTPSNCAVLNGADEYAFWAGDTSGISAPVWIKRNGTAKFQNLYFNGSVIANKETNPEFGIHTTSISPSFNKEYKNTQINTTTSFNISLYPVNKDVYNSIISLEDFGPFSLTEVNSGYLSFNVEFDYEIIISSGRADKNGTIGFYLKYGPNRTALDVSGNPSFTPATSEGSIFGHCSQSGIKFTGLTGGNYEYILQFLLSENGNISNVSLRVFNIRISCQNTIPNLNYGFHIYTNGIIFYKNDSNYFILYDSGSAGLKCLNSLGI